jgi:hypothetical protein
MDFEHSHKKEIVLTTQKDSLLYMLDFLTMLQVHNFKVGYVAVTADTSEYESVDFEGKIVT